MSTQRRTSTFGERDGGAVQEPLAALPHAIRSSLRSPRRLGRNSWFVLILALSAVAAICAFIMTAPGEQGGVRPSDAFPPCRSRASSASTDSPAVSLRGANIHPYRVSPPDAGLMLPAVDQQGNVWFGEMSTNRLARLDPRTGALTNWTPPGGEDGIMGTTVDSQGNVWFAEENANYIGRFDPARHSFSTYSLGHAKSQRVGLQDIQFDSSGKLWFTETVAGRVGRLDPASGTFQTWALSPSSAGIPSYPFGLAITADGEVWFGTYSGGVVGRLDPKTGRVLLYHLASPAEQIYSLAADTHGRIWYTELQFGRLGMIDSTSGKVTEFQVPTTLGNPEDLHSIVEAKGDLWFTSSGANALVRYSPDAHAFTFFRLPEPGSTPFGLALGPAGTLWFTAGGNPVNYIGEMTIPS